MKKLLALVLALCMAMSACAAFADETPGLKDARSYINLIYKSKPASTPKDYELIGAVPGDSETYTVEWTADSDTVAVTRLDSGMVLIDVDENNPKAVEYKLTATIKDAAGNEISISFDRFVPAAINLDIMTEEEIVEAAYGLDDGAALPTPTVLTGTIVAIPSAYSEDYDNITVNIQVGDLADKPIQCYRLMGGSSLQVGDEITVLGTIKNYKGTIEFDKGCYTIEPEYAQSARVVLFAYGLEAGAALSRESTITGVILAIPSAYSADYGNITVNIGVPGLYENPVQCYRLTGGEDLAEGDIITVTGTIKNYNGTIEFDKGCTYVKTAAEEEADELTAALEQLGETLNSEDADLESLLTGFLGLLGTTEEGAEGEEADLSQLLNDLSGLFGGSTEEPEAEAEPDSDDGFLSGLVSLVGSFGGESTGEEGTGEEGGFMNQLLQLFSSDRSGEGSGFMDQLLQLLGDGSGEGSDFLNKLLQLFGEGDASAESVQMSEEDWEALFNELLNLFKKE